MAIKGWNEMRKIDVLPFCDQRDAKDDKGRSIKVPYLNWAKCKELLHQNGAELVYFEPCVNANGSSLFMSDQLVILKCELPELEIVDSLEQTDRGDCGFGSTGR